jgi:hypothetical protein
MGRAQVQQAILLSRFPSLATSIPDRLRFGVEKDPKQRRWGFFVCARLFCSSMRQSRHGLILQPMRYGG